MSEQVKNDNNFLRLLGVMSRTTLITWLCRNQCMNSQDTFFSCHVNKYSCHMAMSKQADKDNNFCVLSCHVNKYSHHMAIRNKWTKIIQDAFLSCHVYKYSRHMAMLEQVDKDNSRCVFELSCQ